MSGKPKLVVIFLSAAIVSYGLIGGILERASAGDDNYGQLGIFNEVLHKIRNEYVESPNLERTFRGALHGMLEALDPYSSFVEASAYQNLKKQAEGGAAVGLHLAKRLGRLGYAYVVAVTPGGPAAEEGLRTGDLVESIGDTVTTELSSWEANQSLLGPAGSEVTLRVVRARRSQPVAVKLMRVPVSRLMPSGEIVESGIGLLKIPNFEKGTSQFLQTRLKILQASGIEGLIVDVRGNVEGNLEEAVASADLLIGRGQKIVSIKDRQGASTEMVALKEPLFDGPAVLLVNGGTSGSAEVFAAALQDNKRALVIGERTNGRGSLQSPFSLSDGAVLFVSTRLFFRPNAKPLQAETLRDSGVLPEIRSPSQEFVRDYFYNNAPKNLDESPPDEFYLSLETTISEEQLQSGLVELRKQLQKSAA